ncbi:hypothetical protein [Maribellus mangrovi]|uniref:hypothetical protein n=1 Tax=Maribellus mangrovi TaxID=3133146 RepID=UPI0030EEA768
MAKSSAGREKIVAGKQEIAQGRGNLAEGSTQTAHGQLKFEREALKLPMDALNCRWTAQIAGGPYQMRVSEKDETRVKPSGSLKTLTVSEGRKRTVLARRTPFNSLKGVGAKCENSPSGVGGSTGARRRNDECPLQLKHAGQGLTNASVRKDFFPLLDRRGCEGSSERRGSGLKDITETANMHEALRRTPFNSLKGAGAKCENSPLGAGGSVGVIRENNDFKPSRLGKHLKVKQNKSEHEPLGVSQTLKVSVTHNKIKSISLVTGERTVANNLKQSSAYET